MWELGAYEHSHKGIYECVDIEERISLLLYTMCQYGQMNRAQECMGFNSCILCFFFFLKKKASESFGLILTEPQLPLHHLFAKYLFKSGASQLCLSRM